MISLTKVQAHEVGQFWPYVGPMIGEGLERRGVPPVLAPILSELSTGIRQLWLATSRERGIEALLMTRFEQDHRGLYCALRLCVGEDHERWVHLLPTIEAWAEANGCFMVTTEWTRTGWEKLLPDYRATRVWLEKELKHER